MPRTISGGRLIGVGRYAMMERNQYGRDTPALIVPIQFKAPDSQDIAHQGRIRGVVQDVQNDGFPQLSGWLGFVDRLADAME